MLPLLLAAASLSAQALDSARFTNPPPDLRPAALWVWNGTITDSLIDRQLGALRARGIGEVVIFPGETERLRPAFFTEEWFARIGHALAEARRTGVHVWLLNDGFPPSGRAAGLVVNGGQVGDRVYAPRPELRPQAVYRTTRAAGGGRPLDVRALWPALGPPPPQLRVADRRLSVEASGVAVLNRGTDWRDYTFSFVTRPLPTATDSGPAGKLRYAQAGWVFRAADERNGYAWLLGNYPHPGARGASLTKATLRDGASTSIQVASLPFAIDSTHWYRIATRVAGDTLETRIDGTIVDRTVDSSFRAGTVGFREDATRGETARFDSVRVTRPDGGVLFATTFADDRALQAFSQRAASPADIVAVAAVSTETIVDLTEQFRRGASWAAPPGDWELQYYARYYHPSFGGPGYLDLMNDDAVRAFLDVVLEEYSRRFPWAFGTALRGFWDDAPVLASWWGLVPWSDSLPRALRALGHAPAQVLPAVFDDRGRLGRIRRGAFWRAVADRFAAAWYRRLGEWAAAHRVAMISEPPLDDAGPGRVVRAAGDPIKSQQWVQVPGADVTFRQYRPGSRTLLPRYAASAAHQAGRSRVLIEAVAAEARSIVAGMAARGANLTVLRFDPSSPWWSAGGGGGGDLVTWAGRVNELGLGQSGARVAVLAPQRAAEAWQDTPERERIDSAFRAIVYALEDAQVDFDFLSESSLDGDPEMPLQAKPKGDELHIGPQRYRVVIVPPVATLSLETAERLRRFADGGGRLIAMARKPTEETRGRDASLRTALARTAFTLVTTATDLQHVVAEAGGPCCAAHVELTPPAPRVRVLERRRGRAAVFLLLNEADSAVAVDAVFPAFGTPELWDPDDGSRRAAAAAGTARDVGTRVSFRLASHKLIGVVFAKSGR